MSEERPVIYYPYESKKLSGSTLKKFFDVYLPVTEVSFPTTEINVLRVETDEYILKCRRIPNKLVEVYTAFGKELASLLKTVSEDGTATVNGIQLKLDRKNLGIFQQGDFMQSWKAYTFNWFRLNDEVAYRDFFGD